jgi:hypothetical protein
MPRVEFEPKIPVGEREKTLPDLDHIANVIGCVIIIIIIIIIIITLNIVLPNRRFFLL